MNACLLSFNKGVAELEQFLLQSQKDFEQLEKISDSRGIRPARVSAYIQTQKELATSRRIHIYKSAVITLYGLLEVYIKELVSGHIQHLNLVSPDYQSLPDSIKNNHTTLSLELIKLAEDDSYRGRKSSEEIISNLLSCYSSTRKFAVNSDAFVYKLQNTRIKQISELLNKISINNHEQSLTETIGFGPYYRDLPERTPESGSALFRENIDDIVTRRNEIAHGVEPTNILSPEILLTKTAFIKAYCNGLYEVVNNKAGEFEFKHRNPKSLGNPIKVINNSIVCFSVRAIKVKVGDILLAKTENKKVPIKRGVVETIEVEKKPHSEFFSRRIQEIGIKTDLKAKPNYTYYLISQRFFKN